MISGDNPDSDQHVLELGKEFFSVCESGFFYVDSSVEGAWKVKGVFMAGDIHQFECLLAELAIYGLARQSSH